MPYARLYVRDERQQQRDSSKHRGTKDEQGGQNTTQDKKRGSNDKSLPMRAIDCWPIAPHDLQPKPFFGLILQQANPQGQG